MNLQNKFPVKIRSNFYNNHNSKNQKGQALVMVMLIGLIALIAVTAAISLVISEIRKNIVTVNGIVQYQIAYGAMENAFMQLLRNPNYTGETVTLDDSTCYITVSGSSTKNVVSRCTDGVYVRKIGATISFTNGIMSVLDITEEP